MITVPIAAALAAIAAPAATVPMVPDADPAIWVVNDSDTVIFLFGTFHALDGRSDWFNDEVRTTFASSDELVLETIIPEAPVVAAEPRPLHGMAIAPPASFLASTRVAISAGRSKGMSVDNGADMVLRRAAETSGKNVGGLESFEYQLGMFTRLPGAGPAAAKASQDPRVRASLGSLMGQMQTAWNRGDQRIFATMLDQMRANSPETYSVMFTERNVNWARWIAQRLRHPGTVFVAVGTGHLVGHDSVQAKLAEYGVRSSRIN